MIKLFYDTAPLEKFPCGVAVYTYSVLKQLIRYDDLEIHTGSKRLNPSGHRQLHDLVRDKISADVKYHPIYFPGRFTPSSFCGLHPFSFNAKEYDIVHFTAHIMPPYVPFSSLDNAILTIHDMFLWHTELGRELNEQEKRHVEVLPVQAEKARAIITCSEFSKREIVKYAGTDPEKIFVIPEAAQWNGEKLQCEPATIARYGLEPQKYFLSVSSLDPHKNHLSLLAAFSAYHSSRQYAGEKLVLAGGRRSGDARTYQKIISTPDVIHLQNVSESDLHQLFLNASGFFLLSVLEGFGLPLLEAMSCRIPACYATGSSMDEIGRDAAYGVDAYDTDAVKELFEKFSAGGSEVKARVEKAYRLSLDYTWAGCAEKTYELYRQLCGK